MNEDTSGEPARIGELLQGVVSRLADPHLAERERELVRERSLHVLGQLDDGAVEPETRLDADGQEIERVGQLRANRLAPPARAKRDKDVRRDEPQPGEEESDGSAAPAPPRAPPSTKPRKRPPAAPAPFAAR